MPDNMRVWSAVPKTDTKHTKNANVDGNSQTTVSGLYMVKLATEVFGPVGEGWGYDVSDERYDNTKPVFVKGKEGLEVLRDGDSIVWEQNHTIRLTLWHGNKENTVTQFGHTKFRYMKADGSKMIIDNEAPKKSMTDALKKCLSLLGICADVYMGMFDDVNYKAAAETENALKNADNADKEYEEQLDKFRAEVDDGVKAISQCPNIEAMNRVYGLKANMVDRRAPVLGLDAEQEKLVLVSAYHSKQKELQESKQ